jgi:hypothetical protein
MAALADDVRCRGHSGSRCSVDGHCPRRTAPGAKRPLTNDLQAVPSSQVDAFEFERARLLLRKQPQTLRNFGVSSDVSEVLGMKLAAVVAL